ncbi:MAG TPA: glycosyltransferase [Chloroflexota bacterium]
MTPTSGDDSRQRISLIVTVRNEVGSIDRLLESIAHQTRPPDEVVIVDGGSTDATWQRLEAWTERLPLRLLREPGANIARGRNVGIAAATSELIAVTDAGVRLAPDWLARLQAALSPDIDVVSGFFKADPSTVFERALGATTLPAAADIQAEAFLPSSRSVLFRRAGWRCVGGYPEWLDYCEDVVFDLSLRRAGQRFAFEPTAIAWFRPRHSIVAFFRQYYLYARGDGKAGLWPRRHAARFAAYALATLLAARRSRVTWLLLAGAAIYTRRPYQRLDLSGLSPVQTLWAVALPPVIRGVGDVAKLLGYPVGVWWRLRAAWTSRSSS